MTGHKWHPMDATAMNALLAGTTAPGVVYALPIAQGPEPMRQQMMGLQSYLVSNYTSGEVLSNLMTVGGEFGLVRTQGDARAYVYGFGTSPDGQVYYAGPFTNFADHHFASSSPVPVEKLFGHTPYSPR